MVNFKAADYQIISQSKLAQLLMSPQALPANAWTSLPVHQPSFLISEISLNKQHYFSVVGNVKSASKMTSIKPIVFVYHRDPVIEMVIDDWVGHFDPIANLTTETGVNHRLWQVFESADIQTITAAFKAIQPLKSTASAPNSDVSYWIADSELPQNIDNFKLPVIDGLVIAAANQN